MLDENGRPVASSGAGNARVRDAGEAGDPEPSDDAPSAASPRDAMGAPGRPRAIRPHPALSPWVQLYFDVGVDPEPRVRRVVPDGSVDILFNLSDEGGTISGTVEPHARVMGILTAPVTVERAAASPLFGASLTPGAARVFLNVPVRSLRNRVVDLRDLWPGEAEDLLARLREATTTTARARDMDAVLLRKLAGARAPDSLLAPAVLLIRAHGGRLPMRAVAGHLRVSERRLERVFGAETGLSPKEFSRIVRIQTVLGWIARAQTKRISWVELACELGFSDQAHLIREFRALTGVTPADYARENGLSHVFNDGLAQA